MKKMIFASLFLSGMATVSFAQEFQMPAPSPTTTIHQDFSTSFIELSYSRPSMNGRKIFGGLLTYGNIWRTGANASTTVKFGEEVSVNGHPVKAGAYSLYTIPGEKEWTVILNSNTGNWGASGFEKKDDVAEFKVPVQRIKPETETFTIAIENMTSQSCDLTLSWENSKIVIPVTADNDATIMAYLDKELKGKKPPYHAAANYYLAHDKDLNLALEYASKAIAENPKAFYIHWTKAKILNKMGKKSEALKEAKIAADATIGTPYAIEYQNNYESLK